MMSDVETAAKLILPFWSYGRATVVESMVDEDQTDSGLIVPHSLGLEVSRGVLLRHMVAPGYSDEGLHEGVVVYYRNGTKIHDVVVVDLDDLIAYEADLTPTTAPFTL